jgi:hypothetical protein
LASMLDLSLLLVWAKLGADTTASDISKNIKNDFAFIFLHTTFLKDP